MAPSRPERAVVIGAGPAGLLAALVLARHGLAVTCLDARDLAAGAPVAQAEHAHVLPADLPDTLADAVPALGPVLRGAVEEGWTLSVDGAAPRPWSFLSREAVEQHLDTAARAASVVMRARARVTGIEPTARGLRVITPADAIAADLVVDASGAARVTAARAAALGLALTLDEIGHPMHYASYAGPLPGGAPRRRALVWNASDSLRAVVLARGDGRFHLTFQADIPLSLPEVAALPRWLAARGAPEVLVATLEAGPARTGATPRRYTAPPVRRLACTDGGGALPWLALGDALLQTPPRFANGLNALARQGGVLARALPEALAGPALAVHLRAALEAEAAALWGRIALAAL
ncbi:lycopene cyclase family protein [Roseovarius salinarum]|uniref:lycopene cyclase family protein n=1 Tax=Roseovarius salinarum TaxID=1981892 RepID=UPI000C332358|nr:lycopene cyclase family protein [Roseovarius salinarum]